MDPRKVKGKMKNVFQINKNKMQHSITHDMRIISAWRAIYSYKYLHIIGWRVKVHRSIT